MSVVEKLAYQSLVDFGPTSVIYPCHPKHSVIYGKLHDVNL